MWKINQFILLLTEMNKDRTWMNWNTFNCRKKPEYINGVK